MTVKERLFERLAHAEKTGGSTGSKNRKKRLIESVQAHLRRILNTQQGTVAIDKGYGIPEIKDLPIQFASPETEEIEKLISRIIARYESRLSDVEVSYQGLSPDGLSMWFAMSATLKSEGEQFPVYFRTGFVPGNKFNVSSAASG